MADDWKPGDKALCVNEGGWNDDFNFEVLGIPFVLPSAGGPKKGDITTVQCAHPSPLPIHNSNDLFLGFLEHRSHYLAACFRKLPPSSEEHVEKLKTSITKKEPTHV